MHEKLRGDSEVMKLKLEKNTYCNLSMSLEKGCFSEFHKKTLF